MVEKKSSPRKKRQLNEKSHQEEEKKSKKIERENPDITIIRQSNHPPIIQFGTLKVARRLIISNQDPLLFIDSHHTSIDIGLAAVNGLQPNPALPVWWPNAAGIFFPITAERLKLAILSYLSTFTNGGIHGECCIAPNTLVESLRIVAVITALNSDPFISSLRNAAMGNGPLFTVYLVKHGKKIANCEAIWIPALGVPLPVLV
jgi:hypothetical protein